MYVFQIKLKYHCSKPIKLQNFLMCSIKYNKLEAKQQYDLFKYFSSLQSEVIKKPTWLNYLFDFIITLQYYLFDL